LELWGDSEAYALAGVAAAIIAGAQVAGGLLVSHVGRFFNRRTSILLLATLISTTLLVCMGLFANFWAVLGLVVLWGLAGAAVFPVRQAYINGLIPSKQRATVLSFDSLLGSSGGVATQPILGKAADVWNYPASYLISGAFQAAAIPFALLAKRAATSPEAKQADTISKDEDPTQVEP
jgi:MFS family permease